MEYEIGDRFEVTKVADRVKGQLVHPKVVLVGDRIRTTFDKGDIRKTFEGVVDRVDTSERDSSYLFLRTKSGEPLYSHYWNQDWDVKITLLEPAPEPHVLDDAVVGDSFSYKGESYIRTFTKFAEDKWVVEVVGLWSGTVSGVYTEDDEEARTKFDQHRVKELTKYGA